MTAVTAPSRTARRSNAPSVYIIIYLFSAGKPCRSDGRHIGEKVGDIA
jgi:hypothetical protein